MKSTTFEDLYHNGYCIRPADMKDLREAVAMFNACSQATIGSHEFTLERYAREWQAPGFNLDEDTRIVLSPDSQIVGCIEVRTLTDPPVHPWVWARVHPNWEGNGVASAMMNWGKARAHEAAIHRVPEDVRIAMYSGTIKTHKPSNELLEGFGMQVVRQSYRMRIDFETQPATPSWPQGIRVRTYKHSEDAEATYRAQEEAFQDHWGYVDVLFEKGFQQWQHFNIDQEHFDPSLWFLATENEEIVGLALCRLQADDNPDLGWVNVLGVRRPWRGRGLGLKLLHHAFNALHERGKRGAALEVDTQSLTGATRLYEKAGMRVERHYLTYELELRPGRE
ncbi:MAG: GNAT family N-acetyltransferase, partial [Anaerolineales bacterium]|nr:GNAT family N-acetyltransferase [Anaerolineales bacterium]